VRRPLGPLRSDLADDEVLALVLLVEADLPHLDQVNDPLEVLLPADGDLQRHRDGVESPPD
jgi:hypothetical protein